MGADPIEHRYHPLPAIDLGRPVQQPLSLADISDEAILVACPARCVLELQRRNGEELSEQHQQLQQAEGVGAPSADVEDLTSHLIASVIGRPVQGDQVIGMQHVTYLLATAGDRERRRRGTAPVGPLLFQGLPTEPADPTLIEARVLAAAVDRGMAEDHRLQAIDPAPVADVLIGGSLGAAVGRREVERKGLQQSVRVIRQAVAGVRLLVAQPLQITVDLVRAAVSKEGLRRKAAGSFEHVKSADDIGQQIAVRILQGRRHRRLATDVGNEIKRTMAPEHRLYGVGIGEIDLNEGQRRGCGAALLKPAQIEAGSMPEQRIKHDDIGSLILKGSRQIRAQKATSACDQNIHGEQQSRRKAGDESVGPLFRPARKEGWQAQSAWKPLSSEAAPPSRSHWCLAKAPTVVLGTKSMLLTANRGVASL